MVQALIWLLVVNGMLAMVLFSAPGEARSEGFIIFSIFTGMCASLGAIIFTQGRIVGEKQSGTAAWMLSKPASHVALLLSKLLATASASYSVEGHLMLLVANRVEEILTTLTL